MKKILIVISCLGVGGGERSLINLLNEFDYMKYKVDLLTLNDSGLLSSQIPNKVNILTRDTKLDYLYYDFCILNIFKKWALKTAIFRVKATLISRKREKNINRCKQYRWEQFYKNYLQCLDHDNIYHLVLVLDMLIILLLFNYFCSFKDFNIIKLTKIMECLNHFSKNNNKQYVLNYQ